MAVFLEREKINAADSQEKDILACHNCRTQDRVYLDTNIMFVKNTYKIFHRFLHVECGILV